MVIRIAPLQVAMSDRTWRGLPFMEHQARSIDLAGERRVLVEAPTGAGKTWAGAAPLLDGAVQGDWAIFAYPTNALADDQQRSLAELVRRSGRRPALVQPDGSLDEAGADVMLWRVHAGAVDESQEVVGGRKRGEVLARVLERLPLKPLWLITNPDTLFLLCTARYTLSPQLWSRLAGCRSIVLDEFHLYRGPTLVRALALLELAGMLIGAERQRILSATLPRAVRALLVERLGFIPVTAAPVQEGRVVQHPVDLSVVSATGQNATAWMAQHISSRIPALRAEAAPGHVPLLVLRQSVLSTISLEDMLAASGLDRGEVGIYRGLTSRAIRSIERKTLVLGTSALEVGVDFNTPRLVFEALSSASFCQRLGRVGRHARGEAVYLTDARVKEGLAVLADSAQHDRATLLDTVSPLLTIDDDLAGFVRSPYGRAVADAAFDALLDRGKSFGARDEFFHAVESARNAFVSQLKIADPPSPESMSRAARKRLSTAVGFRGGPGSVEVFDVRERDRRGSDDLAVYEVDLCVFYRRAEWRGSPTAGQRPLIVGFGKPRTLGLSLAMASASQVGLHAPKADDLQLRVDGTATSWEGLLRAREHLVGIFPGELRRHVSWREDMFGSDDGRVALLDDDALVGAYLWEARGRTGT